jgi:Resolvase, N terminal domain
MASYSALTVSAVLLRRAGSMYMRDPVVLPPMGDAACLAADTRNPTSKLMLTVLAGVATWERMLERQREGIAKARKRGNTRAVRARSIPLRSGD